MKGVVCLWDAVVPEWVFGLLEVEVCWLKIYGKYGERRQHSGSACKREGIALLLLLNHLWALYLAFALLFWVTYNLQSAQAWRGKNNNLNSNVGSRKDKEVMNLILEGCTQFFLSLSHCLRVCSRPE